MQYDKVISDERQAEDVRAAIELLADKPAEKSENESIKEERGSTANIGLGRILSLIPSTFYIASCISNNTLYISYVVLVFTGLALSFIWFPEKYSSSGFRFLSTSSIADGQGEASVPLIKLTGWVFLFLIGLVVFIVFNNLK